VLTCGYCCGLQAPKRAPRTFAVVAARDATEDEEAEPSLKTSTESIIAYQHQHLPLLRI
jgi:hypothetical protein